MTHDTKNSNTSAKSLTNRPAMRQEIDQPILRELTGRMVGDLGAAVTGALVVLGDRLGLYATLERVGPVSSKELAWASNLDERYVREWLANQAASGYVTYDPDTETFSMSPDQKGRSGRFRKSRGHDRRILRHLVGLPR